MTSFATDIATYSQVDGLHDTLASALGGTAPQAFEHAQAWHISNTQELLRVIVVSVGALTMHERTREGQQLVVTVPIERLSRVVLGRSPEATTVTLEIDADQTTIESQATYVEQDAADGSSTQGEQMTRSFARRAGYALEARTEQEVAALERFHRQVSAVLHANA